MTQLLKASPLIETKLPYLIQKTFELKKQNIFPCLKIIRVGRNPSSIIYTNNKKKFAEKIGAICDIFELDENISAEDFKVQVNKICEDTNTHGCLVQLPLPPQLQNIAFSDLIPAEKDVDGFHFKNIGKIFEGKNQKNTLIPCTPKGILTMMRFYDIEIAQKNIVIIGRSTIVGKPLSIMLTNENATVTLCHSFTKNIFEFTKNADTVVCAIGKPNYFDCKFFSPHHQQVVIDVGINPTPGGKVVGDVNFDSVFGHVRAITPVPGGVGPLTILSLAENLLLAAENNSSIKFKT